MNRAERRRAEKNSTKKTATYNLTVDRIDKMRQEMKDEAIEAAFTLALAIPVLVMKDKYPQLMRKEIDGKSREERFADFCFDWFDNVQRGLVTIEGISDQLYEETGIRICRKE